MYEACDRRTVARSIWARTPLRSLCATSFSQLLATEANEVSTTMKDIEPHGNHAPSTVHRRALRLPNPRGHELSVHTRFSQDVTRSDTSRQLRLALNLTLLQTYYIPCFDTLYSPSFPPRDHAPLSPGNSCLQSLKEPRAPTAHAGLRPALGQQVVSRDH